MKKRFVYLTAIIILMLTGCSATTERIGGGQEENTIQEIKTSEEEKENKTDQETAAPDAYYKLTGKRMSFTDIEPELFLGKESYEVVDVEGPFRSWDGSEGNFLCFQDEGCLVFETKDFLNSYDGIIYSGYGGLRDDFESFAGHKADQKGLDGASRVVSDLCQKLKIEVGDMKTYFLDADCLNRLSKEYMSDEEYKDYIAENPKNEMKREFSKADEAYIINARAGNAEYTLCNKPYNIGKTSYEASDIYAIVKEGKVIWFMGNNLYTVEKTEEKIELIEEGTAKKAVQEKYQDTLTAGDISYRNEGIEYIAITEDKKRVNYYFIPVYRYSVTYQRELGEGQLEDIVKSLLIDASNGEVIQ